MFSRLVSFIKGVGRTFGHIKRFQTALLPIMYKLGVLSAVIVMTLFLAFKGVFIGSLILLMNLTFFAIKFGSYLKSEHHQHSAWSPPVINHGSGWPPNKDVHLHIHNAHAKPEYTIPYSTIESHGGWQSNAIDGSGWNSNSYGHTARQLNDIDLTYANADPSHLSQRIESYPSKIIGKREDKGATIVMAQSQPNISPYNYLSQPQRN